MPDNEDMRNEADRLLATAGMALDDTLEGAIPGIHEMYLALRSGGFTEIQALWIVGYILVGGQRPPEDS